MPWTKPRALGLWIRAGRLTDRNDFYSLFHAFIPSLRSGEFEVFKISALAPAIPLVYMYTRRAIKDKAHNLGILRPLPIYNYSRVVDSQAPHWQPNKQTNWSPPCPYRIYRLLKYAMNCPNEINEKNLKWPWIKSWFVNIKTFLSILDILAHCTDSLIIEIRLYSDRRSILLQSRSDFHHPPPNSSYTYTRQSILPEWSVLPAQVSCGDLMLSIRSPNQPISRVPSLQREPQSRQGTFSVRFWPF